MTRVHFGICCLGLMLLTSSLGCERETSALSEQMPEGKEAQAGESGRAEPAQKATPGTKGEEGVHKGKSSPDWVALLKDKDAKVREDAIRALVAIGQPAVPALVVALKDSDKSVRMSVLSILGQIGSKASPALPQVLEATKDEDGSIRIFAAEALTQISRKHTKEAVAVLTAIVSDQKSKYRFGAARALGKIGPPAKSAVPALTQMVKLGYDEIACEAAEEALQKIDPKAAKAARAKPSEADRRREEAWDEILKKRPLDGGKGMARISWQGVCESVRAGKGEQGERAGQRFVLDSGRLLVIEGTDALDVYFPATKEGLLAGKGFLSGDLFNLVERQGLLGLLEKRELGEKIVGLYKVRLGESAGGASSDLPVYWIKVELELADAGGKTAVHAVKLANNYTADELFTASKFRAVNLLIKTHLGGALSAKELSLQVRTLNNLADRAGYTAIATRLAVERAVDETKRKDLTPAAGISATGQSLAFLAATNKEAMQAWMKEAGSDKADKGKMVALPEQIQSLTPTALAKILQDKGYKVDKEGDDSVVLKVGGNTIRFFFVEKKVLTAFLGMKQTNATIKKMNDFNGKTQFVKASLSEKGIAVLTSDLDIEDGVGKKTLDRFIDEFFAARKVFIKDVCDESNRLSK